jgi:hypothetical protein
MKSKIRTYYSSDLRFNELPAEVQTALIRAENAWERFRKSEEQFRKVMSKYYHNNEGGFDTWGKMFYDLGA